MSRGPGKSQRLILETLEKFGPYYLAELAGDTHGAVYKSLHRAAVKLHEQGKIELLTFTYGNRKLAIAAPGVTFSPRRVPRTTEMITAPSVDRQTIEDNTNRLSVDTRENLPSYPHLRPSDGG